MGAELPGQDDPMAGDGFGEPVSAEEAAIRSGSPLIALRTSPSERHLYATEQTR